MHLSLAAQRFEQEKASYLFGAAGDSTCARTMNHRTRFDKACDVLTRHDRAAGDQPNYADGDRPCSVHHRP